MQKITKTSIYVLSAILGGLFGYTVRRLMIRYLKSNYYFTDEDIADIEKGVKTIDELLAEKNIKGPKGLDNIKNMPPPGGGNALTKFAIKVVADNVAKNIIESFIKHKLPVILGSAVSSVTMSLIALEPHILGSWIAGGLPTGLYSGKKMVKELAPELDDLLSRDKIECKQDISFLDHLTRSSSLSDDRLRNEISKVMDDNRPLNKGKYIQFIACLILLLIDLQGRNTNAFYDIIEAIRHGVRTGKISRAMARYILSKLRERGLPVNEGEFD